MAGVLVGIGGVAAAVWIAASVMTRPNRSEMELDAEYKNAKSELRRYLDNNPVYLQGFKDIVDLMDREKAAYAKFDKLSAEYDAATSEKRGQLLESLNEADADVAAVLARSDALVSFANQISLSTFFRRRALPSILVAAFCVAIGLGVFAWAANPDKPVLPTAAISGANLSGADLSKANLSHLVMKDVDFSRTNLTDATLDGANVEGARFDSTIWSNTICPDGSNSDDDGGSCENHLKLLPED